MAMATAAVSVPRSSSRSRTRRSPSPKSLTTGPLGLSDLGHDLASTAPYSASAQLQFLSHNRAANAELFWQMHSTRRNSESEGSMIPSSSSTTVVYVHPVRPTDTIPSVMLTYRIDAQAVRQANRLWAHDSIQSRASLLIPVDQCSIAMQLHLRADPDSRSEARGLPESAELLGWAVVDGVGEVELCAVPRSSLGFFPARRQTNDSRTSVDSASTAVTDASAASTVATETSTTEKPEALRPETSSFFGSAFKAMRHWRTTPPVQARQPVLSEDVYEMIPDE